MQPLVRTARQCGLLSAAQFNRRPTAVTVRSITAGLFALYCYSAHISLPFAPTQSTLYRAFTETDFLLLSQAQFPVHPLRPKSVSPSCGVVIRSTIPTFDKRTYFPIAALPLWQSLHRKCRQSENSPRLLSSTHFPPTRTAAKIFFSEFFRKTVL